MTVIPPPLASLPPSNPRRNNFCDPHSPWQRPSNENTNGLIRQYPPKGTDLAAPSDENYQRIHDELNTRPRKTLHWATPAQALNAFLTTQPATG